MKKLIAIILMALYSTSVLAGGSDTIFSVPLPNGDQQTDPEG